MKEGIQYGLKTSLGKIIPLGEPGQFSSIEEVKKLRVVKDKPDWTVVVMEKKQKQKRVYNSNRWAIVYPDSIVWLSATYTSKTEILETCVVQPPAKIVKYPKDHYHKMADKWFTAQLEAQKLEDLRESYAITPVIEKLGG